MTSFTLTKRCAAAAPRMIPLRMHSHLRQVVAARSQDAERTDGLYDGHPLPPQQAALKEGNGGSVVSQRGPFGHGSLSEKIWREFDLWQNQATSCHCSAAPPAKNAKPTL
ncbi:hypothetical protein [Xaviernesmea oryzae]|uniref:hypothetical protein n=1 Tax=Xaviernesmea oryzae TaxID=464029 RepID=UPI001114485F|nr:hypothetical protein [Xaviernesmea oryzae]